jgi:FAD:protein FMN transferase
VAAHVHKKVLLLMGNRFELSVVAESPSWAEARIEEAIVEIKRIEQLLTTYRDDSQTNLINQQAGIAPVRVDREVFELIERAQRISALTQGAFDITYGAIDKQLWNFDPEMTTLPDPQTARQLVRLVNYKNVILNEAESTVFLKQKGMRIGFGGIGKGYAAQQAKQLLQQKGVVSGIVNAAGDLTTWGNQPNGQPWTIGIAHPDTKNEAFSSLAISNVAVATSGNYEKYAIINGQRYSHTIDPKTGLPVAGIKSVTIVSSNAEIADAMTTPVMVMGVKVGLGLVNQMRGIACIIVDDRNRIYTSNNIKISHLS